MIARLGPDYRHWDKVLRLVQDAFAYMEPIMGFPPRPAAMLPQDLAGRAARGAAWVVRPDDPAACLFAWPSHDLPDALFLSMLAVRADHRGQGLAARLMQAAEAEARARGLDRLTLDTGAALTELRARYVRWGWTLVAEKDGIVTYVRRVPDHRGQTGRGQTVSRPSR